MGNKFVLPLCLCLLAQSAWGQSIPDTPAGENLSAMLDALNSRDRQIIANYAEEYGGGGSINEVLAAVDRIGELRIARVVESDRLSISFVAEAPAIGLQLVGMLAVEDAEPPMLAYSLPWTVLPPGGTVIGFGIDAGIREGLVERIAALLTDDYVFETVGREMADSLRERFRNGSYDEIDNGWILANTLTEELQQVSRDEHLGVYFSPIANGPFTPGPYTRMPVAQSDCGFDDVEQIEDGVAYVKVYEFRDPAQCRQRAEAVLRSLSGSDAIVFDLTDTIGGNWGMWGMVASYFVEPAQLSSLHWRANEYVQTLRPTERLEGLDVNDADVYVLTSSRTFSGGEGFAYDLQAVQRAIVVGEVTGGGAHAQRPERIDERFSMAMPWARVVNPITESNWEGTGVEPDVVVPANEALATALASIRRQSQ